MLTTYWRTLTCLKDSYAAARIAAITIERTIFLPLLLRIQKDCGQITGYDINCIRSTEALTTLRCVVQANDRVSSFSASRMVGKEFIVCSDLCRNGMLPW